MNNLQYAYNLGISDDLRDPTFTIDRYEQKFRANKGLLANLNSLSKQVTLTKSFNEQSVRTVESYIAALESICFSLLRVNSQAKDNKQSILNGYGTHLNEIRKLVYANQNTTTGFVGTLLYHQTGDKQHLSLLDEVEGCLINFWRSINTDPFTAPNERWKAILEELDLWSDVSKYLELEVEVKELISKNSVVKAKAELLLLDFKDLSYLQPRFYCLEFDDTVLDFFKWLYDNEYITFDLVGLRNRLINFNPVGGLNLVLLAFTVEGFALAARYLSYLDLETRMLALNNLYTGETYNDVAQQIAVYLGLSYDAATYLKFAINDISLLVEGIVNDLQLFIRNDIPSGGEYRLDV